MKSSTFILVVIFIELDIKWARDQQVYGSPLNTHLSWLGHMSKKHCVLKLKIQAQGHKSIPKAKGAQQFNQGPLVKESNLRQKEGETEIVLQTSQIY